LPQTRKDLRSPTAGVADTAAGPDLVATAYGRPADATTDPTTPVRPTRRRNASNVAAFERAAGSGDRSCDAGAVAAAAGLASRRNGEDSAGISAPDCGISTYSAESTGDVFAGKVKHPRADAGSTETYLLTARLTGVPVATLQTASHTPEGSPHAPTINHPATVIARSFPGSIRQPGRSAGRDRISRTSKASGAAEAEVGALKQLPRIGVRAETDVCNVTAHRGQLDQVRRGDAQLREDANVDVQ